MRGVSSVTASSPTKGLTVRYVTALALVAITSITAFVLLSALIEGQRGSAIEINISGRQRMLSQRTALFASNLATAETKEERTRLKGTLVKLIQLFRDSNEGLVHGDPEVGLPGQPTAPLRDLYFGETNLYQRVQRYADQLSAVAEMPAPTTNSAQLKSILSLAPGLLVDLNRAVKAYEAQATARVDFLHRAEGALVLFTLLLLISEALIIFRPLVAQIRRHLARIHAQSTALAARERGMRLVLNSTGDGLVAVNLDGSLRDIRSKVVTDWFAEGKPVWEGLFPDDQIKQEEMALTFEGIEEGFMPFEVLVDQMPHRIERDERVFEVGLRPVTDGDDRWLLLIIRDTTAREAHAKAEKESKELIRIVQTISRDRAGFIEFMEEMDRLLDIVSTADVPRDELLRALHTVKGNAAIFGFDSFAEDCHAIETRLSSADESPRDELNRLDPTWREALNKIEVFISETSEDFLHVERDEFRALVHGIRINLSQTELLDMLRQWRNIPAKRRLDRIGQQIDRIAKDLGKRVKVEIDDHQARIPEDFLKQFWPSLVHVVRNTMDHGIEPPEERDASGKTSVGHVTVTAELGDDFVLRIEDDGRGIDWQKIRMKAQERGLKASCKNDLVEALFASGISTRDQVGEISGRGVGMGEVRSQAERAGGTVDVESSAGNGSAFVFRFPRPESSFTQDLGGS